MPTACSRSQVPRSTRLRWKLLTFDVQRHKPRHTLNCSCVKSAPRTHWSTFSALRAVFLSYIMHLLSSPVATYPALQVLTQLPLLCVSNVTGRTTDASSVRLPTNSVSWSSASFVSDVVIEEAHFYIREMLLGTKSTNWDYSWFSSATQECQHFKLL
jgi:hypothetical protein